MTDIKSLVKNSKEYLSFLSSKKSGNLSHAYLFVCPDGENCRAIVGEYAKVILYKDDGLSDERISLLIDNDGYSDAYFYPKFTPDKVSVKDVEDLISESFIKPIEGDRKLFVIYNCETMSSACQNKLLKTLEEPPKGVTILLCSKTEQSLLATVRSRVRKINVGTFKDDRLFKALIEEFPDEERLKKAIAGGDGTVLRAKAQYGDEKFFTLVKVTEDVILNMKSSKDVLNFSLKITSVKAETDEIISVLSLAFRELLKEKNGEKPQNPVFNLDGNDYNLGAVIYALDRLEEASRRASANANPEMTLERLLMQILEGKYKWRKS